MNTDEDTEPRPTGAPAQRSGRTLVVNGSQLDSAQAATVSELLAGLGRDPALVAVERNGDLVRRADFEREPVADGDRIEIVQFVQGG